MQKTAGFETIVRPAELAAASATDPVLRHAVKFVSEIGNPKPETGNWKLETGGNSAAVVMLYGNVPVRRGG